MPRKITFSLLAAREPSVFIVYFPPHCFPFAFRVFVSIPLTAPCPPPFPAFTELISFALISMFLNLGNKVSYTASCYLDAAVNKPFSKAGINAFAITEEKG